MLPNASYFAFTATPKNKTLEIFGEPLPPSRRQGQAPALPQLHDEAGDPGGLHPRRAQELHAGRQLLQAGQDRSRTTRSSTPSGRKKKLRRYVESHDHAIRLKAEIMVDHFHEQVLGAEQDRRPGAGDGGDQRHRAGDPVLPRVQRRTSRSARARTRRSSPSPASTSTAARR